MLQQTPSSAQASQSIGDREPVGVRGKKCFSKSTKQYKILGIHPTCIQRRSPRFSSLEASQQPELSAPFNKQHSSRRLTRHWACPPVVASPSPTDSQRDPRESPTNRASSRNQTSFDPRHTRSVSSLRSAPHRLVNR